ncbi:restriction endonuclease subunit S [Clostridium paraputrificum]|uniref:restriction endonuclease subunit S n=1 Tax=Clostridium paraputrificum TaxID=29363 RepID=UPI00232B64A7|nr:restriction endonuclease subunit S [Clostridium paraputrificum]MDB2107890.1 restriction endonuclease subunit S [Clostridium paraputrificum]MDB2114812.1 restriction endonuclease subunit S [Clostridium paraputrificum]
MIKYKLGDVVKVRSERVNNPASCSYDKFVGLEHYVSGEIEIKKYGDTSLLKSAMKVFRAGDILVARRNVYLKRASIVKFDGITSGDSIVLQVENKLLRRIIPFVLNTDNFWEYAEKFSDGTMSKRLSPKVLLEYEFMLPELDEQEKLAELLWAANNTKDAYKKLIHLTDELVIAQFIEMFGDPNKSVDTVSLEEAFEIRNDLRKPLSDAIRSEMHTGELYPYYGANGQVDMINEYLMDCTALCLAEDCGSYGPGEATSYIITGKSWVNNHAHVLIPRECCDIEFANIYFKILDMSEYVTGTTRLKLTKGKMREIPFVLHPMDKQKQFATFVQKRDKSVSELQQNIDNLEKMIKALMTKNFG